MTLRNRIKQFETPSAALRGKPFWAWNGKLEEDEVLRQIDAMKAMGFGGFFMHSRTGLETEYLGEDWFRIVNVCADYGGKQGMEAWLYDEDRWPSGSAGGAVTRDSERFRPMFLHMTLLDGADYRAKRAETEADPATVAVFALDEKDGFFSTARRLTAEETPKDGDRVALFTVVRAAPHPNYNNGTYLNTLDREATEAFLSATHEAYRRHCGDRLGRTIPGIFSDEPHRGASFATFDRGSEQATPYTDDLFPEFEKRFGYSLSDRLPDLFLRHCEGELSPVKRDYYELCEELFVERFFAPIQSWCHEHGLKFTGHVLAEDTFTTQIIMQGSLMRCYEYMDVPGLDCLTENTTAYWMAKQVSSVVRQLDKAGMLSELYGCTGWQTDFETYKAIGDWQALFGVTLRCPHLSWYTMKGEAKRDFPASILHQSTWYRDFPVVEDYFSRINAAFRESEPICDLLVLNPIESAFARAYSGAFYILFARDPEIKRLEQRYEWTFHVLADRGIDFDYGEEGIMARHGRVENGVLYVGKAAYRKVLVSGMDTMRAGTLALLNEFAAAGGTVVFAGEPPRYVDARPSDRAEALARRAVTVPFEPEAVAAACRSGREIGIGAPAGSLIFTRQAAVPGGRMVMVLNMSRTEDVPLTLDLGEGLDLERWDPRTGRITRPAFRRENGRVTLSLTLEKSGERLYLLPDHPRALPDESVFTVRERIASPEVWSYRLTEPNVCVLDVAEVTSGLGRIAAAEVLKADRALRDLLGLPWRSGEMLQPWYQIKTGGAAEVLDRVTVTHRFTVEKQPDEISLVVESLDEIDAIRINGRPLSLIGAGRWIDVCFDRLPIPDGFLVPGENTVEIDRRYHAASGLEASYLIGPFGVRTEKGGAVLTELPETLSTGDVVPQGLPFYSGTVIYEWPADRRPAGTVRVTAEAFGGALVKLHGKDGETVPIAFPPYRAEIEDLTAIEVVLTRRNTFGPLHQVPKRAEDYGPENFVTEDEWWSDDYQLLETGLLAAPTVETPRPTDV